MNRIRNVIILCSNRALFVYGVEFSPYSPAYLSFRFSSRYLKEQPGLSKTQNHKRPHSTSSLLATFISSYDDFSISNCPADCNKTTILASGFTGILGRCMHSMQPRIPSQQILYPHIKASHLINTSKPNQGVFPTTKDTECQGGTNSMGTPSVCVPSLSM